MEEEAAFGENVDVLARSRRGRGLALGLACGHAVQLWFESEERARRVEAQVRGVRRCPHCKAIEARAGVPPRIQHEGQVLLILDP